MTDKKQFNQKDVSPEAFAEFVRLLSGDSTVIIKKHSLPTPQSHNDVYYCDICGDLSGAFVFHYDLKACILQITAESEILNVLTPQAQACAAAYPREVKKTPQKPAKKTVQKPPKATQKTIASPSAKEVKAEEPPALPEYKNGYSVKKYAPEWVEAVVTKISSDPSYKVAADSPDSKQKSIRYVIESRKDKIYVQYAPKTKVLQLQGKDSEAYRKIQRMFLEKAGVIESLQAHIEFSQKEQKPAAVVAPELTEKPAKKSAKQSSADKKAQKISAELVKAIPHAYKYLSDQSKKYLMYALADLNMPLNSYSGILGEAYKALENLISNLQKSKGIEVKLIGQAYEKPGAAYTLKASYIKKGGSVIYAEVMAALYNEYFNRRHYFSHSDNEFGTVRIISSRQAAKDEFNNLLALLDYNCRKLSETGFNLKENK